MSASTKDDIATLHYLATGLVQWEETPPEKRIQIPPSLRLGMSRMYAAAALSQKQVPTTLSELFEFAAKPIKSWWEPAKVPTIPDTATLLEYGLVSDFTREWALSGKDSIHQIQELPRAKLKEFCERHQFDDSYRKARGELIVAQPVLKLAQLRKKLDTKELAKVRDFFNFSQAGVLPEQFFITEDDSIPEQMWLTCCLVIRHTSKTTWSGLPSLVVVVVRVNPFLGEVEFTTPSVKQQNRGNRGWVSSWEIYNHLLTENWDSQLYEDSGEEDLNAEETEQEERNQRLLNQFLASCLTDCLTTQINNETKPDVLFMMDGQNARSTFKWLQNPNLKCGEFPNELRSHILEARQKRLHIVRSLTKGNTLETPPCHPIGKNPGSRHYGIYAWRNVCDNPEQEIYLGLRETLNTEQDLLRVNQSRLDNGKSPAGNPPLLEYDVIHSSFDNITLIRFLERLRNRWAYFSGTTSLPFPFPYAKHARDYAISLRDEDFASLE